MSLVHKQSNLLVSHRHQSHDTSAPNCVGFVEDRAPYKRGEKNTWRLLLGYRTKLIRHKFLKNKQQVGADTKT